MQGVCVLGATGSVGRNTLDVLARHPERFRVVALSADRDADGMAALVRAHNPERVVMADPAAARTLAGELNAHACEVLSGAAALNDLAADPAVDIVMAAIVGAAGLPATFAAALAGKRILLATKEALVTAGPLLLQTLARSGGQILPIDSEHNAVFQCLPQDYACGTPPPGVRRIILTASGGPFRDWTSEQMQTATPAQAVAHPNWEMGRKISVDSASLMNKALELVEAAYLYDLPEERVDVVVHRQSVIHSLVEFLDGSLLAQLGSADMRIPIAHALLHPQRGESGAAPLDLVQVGQLDFAAPDSARFPALDLARAALRGGGARPAVLNAANEIAVEAFLAGAIRFPQISALVADVLNAAERWLAPAADLAEVLEIDHRARQEAQAWRVAHA